MTTRTLFRRNSITTTSFFVSTLFVLHVSHGQGAEHAYDLPLKVDRFDQQIHTAYTEADGLPSADVTQIATDKDATIYANTNHGYARCKNDRWQSLDKETDTQTAKKLFSPPKTWYDTLADHISQPQMVRAVAQHAGEIAVAAESGLFIGDGNNWILALPQDGHIRWAPIDVRAVAYDAKGQLWYACPQGVGFREASGEWNLFTGADGLPYNDFTCMAAGPKGVWFGTTNGAILYHEGEFEFRQGGRWLIHNHVRDIAVDADGTAWFATPGGVSRITSQPTTLEAKASFFEDEIERYHRRTSFGYVNPAELKSPGDKSTAVATYSDNDGFNTGLFLSAMCMAYTSTEDPKYRQHAENSFRALAFLSEVTQGGKYGAPAGFIARNVSPISDPDPNERYDLAYDVRRNKADTLWKIIQPRVPVDASGKWYWKCDSSSDELDGHFFGYACYYDHICQTEQQKEEVRQVTRRIIDHILKHGYNLVDYDGKPTRWGRFSPDDLNRNEAWCDERGLNSYSILTYLTIAHHITGDPKYREVYLKLALDHGYGMNGMTQPKALPGPNSPGHQPDDNMAFMNYYHLIRYETDPKLLSMYYHAIHTHWKYERLERDSFTNFIYAACCMGKKRQDHWGETDLTPPRDCFEDAIDTLVRYPLDLVEWSMSNAHRTDLLPMGDPSHQHANIGGRVDGYAFPIDQRHETYWDWDPWRLTFEGKGLRLRPGFHYLLAYYMARAHGFIEE